MGVVAVVGVEGGVLVGYNRLCGVICGVDLEMFLSEWAALCFLFVSCCCGSGPGHDIALLVPGWAYRLDEEASKTIYCTSVALSRCSLCHFIL